MLIDQGVVKTLEIVGNQFCSNGGAAVTNGACGATGNPYSNAFVRTTTEPAPGGNQATVFTFGTQHGAGASGMNPAGNVQQILTPASTQSYARLLRHRHWVQVIPHHKHHKK